MKWIVEAESIDDIVLGRYVIDLDPLKECKDCRHWKNGHLCESLSRYGTFETKADFYCGYARRREE